MQVEAVARLCPHQVAQTWHKLRRADLGPWLGLRVDVSVSLSKSLLDEMKQKYIVI